MTIICPDCGSPNPRGGCYCGSCGSLLDKKDPRSIDYNYLWERLEKGIKPVDEEYLIEHISRLENNVLNSFEYQRFIVLVFHYASILQEYSCPHENDTGYEDFLYLIRELKLYKLTKKFSPERTKIICNSIQKKFNLPNPRKRSN